MRLGGGNELFGLIQCKWRSKWIKRSGLRRRLNAGYILIIIIINV